MRWLILLFIFLSGPLLGELKTVWPTDALDPSSIHLGCVNVTTGEYVENSCDLFVDGVEPLSFHRAHTSSNKERQLIDWAWEINPCSLTLQQESQALPVYTVKLNSPDGGIQYFDLSIWMGREHWGWSGRPRDPAVWCNTGRGEISGQTNPKGTVVKDYQWPHLSVYRGDGERMLFTFDTKKYEEDLKKREEKRLRVNADAERYLEEVKAFAYLTCRESPSGRKIDYSLDPKNRLKRVEGCSPDGERSLGWIEYEYGDRRFQATTSDGQKLTALISKKEQITRVEIDGRFWIEYDYATSRRVVKRRTPQGGYLEIDYSQDSHWVRALHAPVGPNGDRAKIAEFSYYPFTAVVDPYGHRVEYHVDDQKRLLGVNYFDRLPNGGLQRVKAIRFGWHGKKEWEGNLSSKEILGADDLPLVTTTLSYDNRGNVVEERLLGNLSGNSSNETFSVYQRYPSDDASCSNFFDNRLIERIEGEKRSRFTYLGEANLVASELVYIGEKLCQRLFHEYDENHALVKSIADNGSMADPNDLTGVTKRIIARTERSRSEPSVGLPIKRERWYWDPESGEERLLERWEIEYDNRNLPIRLTRFDTNGDERYVISRIYGLHRQVIMEIDSRLEESRYFQYDERGNCISERGPRRGAGYSYVYDAANRLTQMNQFDGHRVWPTCYRYDLNSCCVEEEDWLGHVTTRSYDSLGRVTCETSPLGGSRSYIYDAQGCCSSETNELGQTTLRRFTARNEPYEILYPDGTSERRTYNLEGREIARVDRNGVSSTFSYDGLGHLIQMEMTSREGEVKRFSYTYLGDELILKCDPMGLKTSYRYDGAGRLIEEWCDRSCTRYEYDSMGRQYRTLRWFGEGELDYLVSVREYDLFDRLIDESEESADGELLHRLSYAYDELGNCIERKSYGEGGEELNSTSHDVRGRPTCKIDPLCRVTFLDYPVGADGNQECRVTDPLCNVTITHFDPLNRMSAVEQLDKAGTVLSRIDYSYDLAGNLIEERRLATSPLGSRELVTQREFGPCGRQDLLIEPDGKMTRFIYNSYGELIQKELPDGSSIDFTYDGWGRLSSEKGADYSYTYAYDLADRLLSSTDSEGQKTELQYDPLGNLISEKQASGYEVRYTCDRLGRKERLILPDGSSVDYHYNPLFLDQVVRTSPSGKRLYTHDYLKRDLKGRLLEEQSPGFTLKRDWNGAGQPHTLVSPTYRAEFAYDRAGNLIEINGSDPQSFTYDSLYQLASEKGVANHTYLHDSVHNRLVYDDEHYQVDLGNRVVEGGGEAFGYDGMGNLASRDRARYQFDHRGRLTRVELDGTAYSYGYDSFDRRISKRRLDGGRERVVAYLYDGMCEVGELEEGQWLAFRALGASLADDVGGAVAFELQGKTLFPLHNHRGDLVQLLSDWGEVVESYCYSAFGEELSGGKMAPWRFSSKRVDLETGLSYFGRRFYDPSLGRWISPDPEGYGDGPNLYAYVRNRPLILIDPTGTKIWDTSFNFFAAQDRVFDFDWRNDTAKGIAHAGIDVARSTAQFWHEACFDIGSLGEDSLFDLVERHTMSRNLAALQSSQTEWIDSRLQGLLNVDSSNADYCFARNVTRIGLEIGSAYWGSVSCVKSVANFCRFEREIGRLMSSGGRAAHSATREIKACNRVALTAERASLAGQGLSKIEKTNYSNPLQGTRYSSKVLEQMQPNAKTGHPDFHGFPRIVDNYADIGQKELIVGKDGHIRTKISVEGGYQGRDGTFEWILESDDFVNHRLFVPKH